MTRTCPDCGLVYDDTYRWTYCPHDTFEMRSLTMRADGTTKMCHTIEEQNEFLGFESEPDPLPVFTENALVLFKEEWSKPSPVVVGIDHHEIKVIQLKSIPQSVRCLECKGDGCYWTEWSDAASADPELARHVLLHPDPPDGTVLFRCQECQGTGHRPHPPTPAEMMILIHGIMMLMGGTVLACYGMEDVEWFAIPAAEWYEGGWRVERKEDNDVANDVANEVIEMASGHSVEKAIKEGRKS